MKSGPCFIIARITLDKMGLIKRVLLLERGFVPGRRWLTRPGPPTGGARGGALLLVLSLCALVYLVVSPPCP